MWASKKWLMSFSLLWLDHSKSYLPVASKMFVIVVTALPPNNQTELSWPDVRVSVTGPTGHFTQMIQLCLHCCLQSPNYHKFPERPSSLRVFISKFVWRLQLCVSSHRHGVSVRLFSVSVLTVFSCAFSPLFSLFVLTWLPVFALFPPLRLFVPTLIGLTCGSYIWYSPSPRPHPTILDLAFPCVGLVCPCLCVSTSL